MLRLGMSIVRRSSSLGVYLLVLLGSVPAGAEVTSLGESGFVIVHSREVNQSPEVSFDQALQIQNWWDKSHTYTGDSANLSLKAEPGGLFSERFPNGGFVEHMRVAAVQRPMMLRMNGALGPLAFDGLAGSLTLSFGSNQETKGTTIRLQYVVGGYRKDGFKELAPIVDKVLQQQCDLLAERINAVDAKIEATKTDDSKAGAEQAALPESARMTAHTYDKPAEFPVAQANIDQFQFIVGRWVGPGLGGQCEEVWSPPLAGEMQGMFQFVEDNKIVFRELFALRQDSETWKLTLKHFGPAMKGWEEKAETTDFELLAVGENKAWFRGLTMQRIDDSTLHVYVAMRNKEGEYDEAVFRYQLK